MKKKYTAVAYTCFEMQKPDGRVRAKKTHRVRGIRSIIIPDRYGRTRCTRDSGHDGNETCEKNARTERIDFARILGLGDLYLRG